MRDAPLVVDADWASGRIDAVISLVYQAGARLYADGALDGGLLAAALLVLAPGLLVQGWTPTWAAFLVAAAARQEGSTHFPQFLWASSLSVP